MRCAVSGMNCAMPCAPAWLTMPGLNPLSWYSRRMKNGAGKLVDCTAWLTASQPSSAEQFRGSRLLGNVDRIIREHFEGRNAAAEFRRPGIERLRIEVNRGRFRLHCGRVGNGTGLIINLAVQTVVEQFLFGGYGRGAGRNTKTSGGKKSPH